MQFMNERMDGFEARLTNNQDDNIKSAKNEIQIRSNKKRFVIKNIPDNNNENDDLQYLHELLNPDNIRAIGV